MTIPEQIKKLFRHRLMVAFQMNILATLCNVAVFQLLVQPTLYGNLDTFEIFNRLYYATTLASGLTGTVALYYSVGRSNSSFVLLYLGLGVLGIALVITLLGASDPLHLTYIAVFFPADCLFVLLRRNQLDKQFFLLLGGEAAVIGALMLAVPDFILLYICAKTIVFAGGLVLVYTSVTKERSGTTNDLNVTFLIENMFRYSEKHASRIFFIFLFPIDTRLFPVIVVTGLLSMPIGVVASMLVAHEVTIRVARFRAVLWIAIATLGYGAGFIASALALHYVYDLRAYSTLALLLLLRGLMSISQLVYANGLEHRRSMRHYSKVCLPVLITVTLASSRASFEVSALLLSAYFCMEIILDYRAAQHMQVRPEA